MTPPRVLFVFVDGVGVGADDRETNPLAALDLPALATLLGGTRPVAGATPSSPSAAVGGRLLALDACLGVAGLPQSGTGQTTLLTGVNAPAAVGEHQGPYPTAALKGVLAAASLFRRLRDAGRPVALANAFPAPYLERAARGTGRMGAIARAAHLAGVRLRGPDDLRAGRALSAFVTNAGWRERLGHPELPDIDAAAAGRRLSALAQDHAFTLFEYYATDLAGHHPDRWPPANALRCLDDLIAGVLATWAPRDVVVLASDHGNLEDMRVATHTRNPALGAWCGPAPAVVPAALTDVAPAILAAVLGSDAADAAPAGPGARPAAAQPSGAV